jgi:hypothetical protein
MDIPSGHEFHSHIIPHFSHQSGSGATQESSSDLVASSRSVARKSINITCNALVISSTNETEKMVKCLPNPLLLLLVTVAFHGVWGFTAPAPSSATGYATVLRMGLFDGIAKAFTNQDFKSQDQRVRASHILIKGDDIDQVLSKVKTLFGEINERSQEESLNQVFAEVARRESMCSSASQGGDLGQFGAKKMVPEFDEVLFPASSAGPPAGALLGPVVTEFGCHIVLVTQRDENKDQVEEKLARIDTDAL